MGRSDGTANAEHAEHRRIEEVGRAGFRPPRKRNAASILEMAVVGNQPMEGGGANTRARSTDDAKEANTISIVSDAARGNDERQAIAQFANQPDVVISRRMSARCVRAGLVLEIDCRRQMWSNALPSGAHAKALRFPLMAMVTNAMDFHDKDPNKDLPEGFR